MGMYGHVEPVIGIQSNHPLNDPTVYDDDVVMHYNDGGTNTVYRPVHPTLDLNHTPYMSYGLNI